MNLDFVSAHKSPQTMNLANIQQFLLGNSFMNAHLLTKAPNLCSQYKQAQYIKCYQKICPPDLPMERNAN